VTHTKHTADYMPVSLVSFVREALDFNKLLKQGDVLKGLNPVASIKYELKVPGTDA